MQQEPNIALRIGDGIATDVILNLGVRAFAVLLSIAVARLLTPADFGAVSLALSAFGVGEALTDLSLGTALIRQSKLTRELVDFTWTLGLIRSLSLAGLVMVGADAIGRLLGHPEVSPYVRVLALGSVATSLQNLYIVNLQRELRFRHALLVENSRFFFGSLFSLALLLATRNAMSLAVGPALGNALTALLTWIFVRPRPRLRWSAPGQWEALRFGRWMMGQNVVVYLFSVVDNLYVGRFLGLAALGAYAFAWRVVNTVMTMLTRSLPKLLTSAYAKLQTDAARLAETAVVALTIGSAVGLLLLSGVLLGARDLLVVLGGGHRWDAAVPIACALTVSVYARVLGQVLIPLFHAVGDARTATMCSTVQLGAVGPAIVVGDRLAGLNGVAFGVTFAALLRVAVTAVWISRRFELSVVRQLKAVVPGVLVVSVVAAAGIPLRSLPVHPLLRLALIGAWLVVSFLAVWELCRSRLGRQAWPALAAPGLKIASTMLSGVGRKIRRVF